MGRLCTVRAEINGIYGWGVGYYKNEYSKIFDRYFDSIMKSNSTFKFGMNDGVQLLYGMYGSLFIHPMEITGVLHTSNCAESDMFEYELKALDEILNGLKEFFKLYNVDIEYKILYEVIADPDNFYPKKLFYGKEGI